MSRQKTVLTQTLAADLAQQMEQHPNLLVISCLHLFKCWNRKHWGKGRWNWNVTGWTSLLNVRHISLCHENSLYWRLAAWMTWVSRGEVQLSVCHARLICNSSLKWLWIQSFCHAMKFSLSSISTRLATYFSLSTSWPTKTCLLHCLYTILTCAKHESPDGGIKGIQFEDLIWSWKMHLENWHIFSHAAFVKNVLRNDSGWGTFDDSLLNRKPGQMLTDCQQRQWLCCWLHLLIISLMCCCRRIRSCSSSTIWALAAASSCPAVPTSTTLSQSSSG